MAFQIIRSDESIKIGSVTILIYGEAGAGKTSLANTANNPLTLDFDKGIHRSSFRKDVLVIKSWAEIANDFSGLLAVVSRYDTIVIDTVDTLLDFMGAWIVEQDPKLGRQKLQFYGRLKEEFSLFIGKLKTFGKDIVLVAHVKEKDEGDVRIKRPAITGGSYDRVLQVADFVGYVYLSNGRRTLNFNPTEFSVGKNSGKLPALTIPDFSTEPTYFSDFISEMKAAIEGQTESQTQAISTVMEAMNELSLFTTAEGLTNYFTQLSARKLSKVVKAQIWDKLQKHASELGFVYDKNVKGFIAMEVANAA